MTSLDRFETKRGECRIEDGVLILDGSFRGHLANLYAGYWQSDSWWHKWIFLSHAAAVPVSVAALLFGGLSGIGDAFLMLGAVLVALAAVYAVQRYGRGFTSRSRIPLDAIVEVTLTEGTTFLTRPRFVVTYELDEERHRRYVTLPSLSMPDGRARLERAKSVFEARGLATDWSD